MTYEDNLSGRIESERIDRLAEWLEATIGPQPASGVQSG